MDWQAQNSWAPSFLTLYWWVLQAMRRGTVSSWGTQIALSTGLPEHLRFSDTSESLIMRRQKRQGSGNEAILSSNTPHRPLLTWSCQLHQLQALHVESCKPEVVPSSTFFLNGGSNISLLSRGTDLFDSAPSQTVPSTSIVWIVLG